MATNDYNLGWLSGGWEDQQREKEEKLDQDEAYRYAQLSGSPYFKQGDYRIRQGENMVKRGVGQAFEGAAGLAGFETQDAKRQNARDEISAIPAEHGSDAWYTKAVGILARNGFVAEAQQMAQAAQSERTKRAQQQSYESQAAKAHAGSTHEVDKLMESRAKWASQLASNPNAQRAIDAIDRELAAMGAPKSGQSLGFETKVVPATDTAPAHIVTIDKATGRVVSREEIGGAKKGAAAGLSGEPLSPYVPGSEADKAYQRETGKESAKWLGGDRSSAVRGVEALNDVVKALQVPGNSLVDDPVSSNLPDWMRATVPSGKAAIDMRDTVRQAVQVTLKATLGAQFTEKEAEQLFARAYDVRLTPQQNVIRLNRAITELQDKIARKDAAARGVRPSDSGNAGGNGRVKVMSPTGQVGTIPASDLARAKSQGYREVE